MLPIDITELSKSLLTAALTASVAIIVLVIGQSLQKFTFEPLQIIGRTIGEISFALIYFANVYPETSSPEEIKIASDSYRKLAARVISDVYAIQSYWFVEMLRLAPSKYEIDKAASLLIFLSNSVFHTYDERVENARKDIRVLLKIRPLK